MLKLKIWISAWIRRLGTPWTVLWWGIYRRARRLRRLLEWSTTHASQHWQSARSVGVNFNYCLLLFFFWLEFFLILFFTNIIRATDENLIEFFVLIFFWIKFSNETAISAQLWLKSRYLRISINRNIWTSTLSAINWTKIKSFKMKKNCWRLSFFNWH